MITFKSLKHKTDRSAALRLGLYFPRSSKAATNITEVKQIYSDHYGEEVSYSVMVAQLSDFFLQHHVNLLQSVKNPEE
jgi:hypothetical protein